MISNTLNNQRHLLIIGILIAESPISLGARLSIYMIITSLLFLFMKCFQKPHVPLYSFEMFLRLQSLALLSLVLKV